MYLFHRIRFQCDIPAASNIENVYFCHSGFGIVINPEAIIGPGTIIQHGVTIGEMNGPGAPIIGENCYIGARALVLGKIHIGKNVKIGAGAVVLSDVPDGCTAVGVPAKIIKKEIKNE